MNHSKSGPSITIANKLCQTPRSLYLQNRPYVFFQSPRPGERSLQRAPVLKIQKPHLKIVDYLELVDQLSLLHQGDSP